MSDNTIKIRPEVDALWEELKYMTPSQAYLKGYHDATQAIKSAFNIPTAKKEEVKSE